MALDQHFLEYPHRRHGMDHDLYKWSPIFDRKPMVLPNQDRLALMVTVVLEFFPLNPQGKPFKAPGSMVTSYPDFRHYTTRDYGNRVGIFRMLRVLRKYDIKCNMAVNATLADRYPSLIDALLEDGHEIVAHGIDMDMLHYTGLDIDAERSQIISASSTLQKATGQKLQGWMSPAYSESFNTLDLLAECGYEYVCDWSNDDLPYTINTKNGNITALPVSQEMTDRQILINNHHTEDGFLQQVKDQFDVLYDESKNHGGRILSLVLTPYISGLPFRIQSIDRIFDYVLSKSATRSMIGSQVCEISKL